MAPVAGEVTEDLPSDVGTRVGSKRRDGRGRWGLVVGLLAAVPLFGSLAALLRWTVGPSLDTAIIAVRSWDVLSSSPPLVGQLTQACHVAGRPVYSPGPLLYWFLALPVHLSPGKGVVVGST